LDSLPRTRPACGSIPGSRRHRMQRIGFAPWKPLPPLIDDPEWDVETFAEQAERLDHVADDDGDDGPALSVG
jgi:hypothetical protein